jgi:XRE family transcriptional regulator, aerobic/anaerobic benzoate catabolism transcriptional regulator
MSSNQEQKHPLLVTLSQQLRAMRAERGLTRKQLALNAGVSERHLANLETGVGNVSVMILLQVSLALNCSIAQLLGDFTTASREWMALREMLEHADQALLRKIRFAVKPLVDQAGLRAPMSGRIALIGLRGAGKSTFGRQLAQQLNCVFVELSRDIEKLAGGPIAEIQALYGQSAYRRYERRALDGVLARYQKVVIAMPGGVVTDSATYNELLSQCTTIWLQAEPEDHMRRVVAQGDLRPMASSKEAMADLRAILAAREPLYARADFRLNTSAQSESATFALLRSWVLENLALVESEEVL